MTEILEHTSPTDLARALAARRRKVEGTCVVCGTQFEGTTKRRYCSNRCAKRASRRGMSTPYKKQAGGQQAGAQQV
jgi:hypothetical protein